MIGRFVWNLLAFARGGSVGTELFESIFRVIMIFFLSVVDSNTCDKIGR